MKISKEGLEQAIKAYEDCFSIAELANTLDVSRQALWKAFKRAGVDTTKGVATRRDVECDQCGKTFNVPRSRFRNMGKSKFCSDVCYYTSKENSGSRLNRHKQRIARWKVSQVFDLKDEMVVHHKDRDHFNTMMRNLVVFKHQGDHTKHHHEERLIEMGKLEAHEVVPVWDGTNFKGPEPTESMKGKAADDWAKTLEGIKESQKREKHKKKVEAVLADQEVKTAKGPVKANKAMSQFWNPQPKAKWKAK